MLIPVVFLAFILRLISADQSLWLDEAINVQAVRQLNVVDLVTKYSLGDFHPPLYHLVLKLTGTLFGYSELAVRMPSILFGTLSVVLIFFITRKLFETKTALIASLLLATAPLHIYYSQEARMYSMATFITLLSVYFFISIIRNDKLFYWVGLIISGALLLLTDYMPYFLIPAQILYLFIARKDLAKSTLKTFFPAFLLIFIIISPWIFIFVNQFSQGLAAATSSPVWSKVVGDASVKNLFLIFVKFTVGRVSIDNNFYYFLAFVPAGMTVILLTVLSIFRLSKQRIFLWFWFFIPIVSAFALSFYVPIFSYFRFLFVLPAFYIIIASGINTINHQALVRTLLITMIVINLLASITYLTNPKFQRENWRDAANFVNINANEDSVALFLASEPFPPYEYYSSEQIESVGALESFNSTPKEVENKIGTYLKEKNKVYLFQYLTDISDPQGLVFMEITKRGFTNTKTKNFNGVGFIYEFQNQKAN